MKFYNCLIKNFQSRHKIIDKSRSIDSDRVCGIVYNTPADKVSFVKDKMLKNNSSCGCIHNKADNWQSGDSAYFYLSPYLNLELKFKNYSTFHIPWVL